MHMLVKNLFLLIFIHAPQSKFFPMFLSSHHRQREMTHAAFFDNLFPRSNKGEGKGKELDTSDRN